MLLISVFKIAHSHVYRWSIKDKAIWIADDLAQSRHRYHSSSGSADNIATDALGSVGSTSDNKQEDIAQQQDTLERLKKSDGLDVGGGMVEMHMVDCLLLTKHLLWNKHGSQ